MQAVNQDCDNAAVFLLDHGTDDLVVEVVDSLPRDALAGILLLLLPQRQLHKHLLQLFIAVVDAQLLKADYIRIVWEMAIE